MLRIVLSVAGVLCIGLGMFWGTVSGSFGGNDNAMNEQSAQAESRPTDNATVAITDATSPVQLPAVESEVAVAADDAPEATVASVSSVPAVEEQAQPADLVTASLENTLGDPSAGDNAGGEGAVPVAPAQKAGDLIAMAEQAKSSSRNQEVGIAKTILASSIQSSDSGTNAVVDKTVEVATATSTTVGSLDDSEVLVVTADKVNLRDGPSIEHPIVLTLEEGQELMEFKREGKWVHVGAYGTSGKIGWVHERLVGQAE